MNPIRWWKSSRSLNRHRQEVLERDFLYLTDQYNKLEAAIKAEGYEIQTFGYHSIKGGIGVCLNKKEQDD